MKIDTIFGSFDDDEFEIGDSEISDQSFVDYEDDSKRQSSQIYMFILGEDFDVNAPEFVLGIWESTTDWDGGTHSEIDHTLFEDFCEKFNINEFMEQSYYIDVTFTELLKVLYIEGPKHGLTFIWDPIHDQSGVDFPTIKSQYGF